MLLYKYTLSYKKKIKSIPHDKDMLYTSKILILNRKDPDQLDGTSVKQSKFVPTAEDYARLEKENEKLKKLFAEQALERNILKDLLKKRTLTYG